MKLLLTAVIILVTGAFSLSKPVALVSRGPETDASLSGLTATGLTISPVFSSAVMIYTTNVTTTVANVVVTPTVNAPGATVLVNGLAVTSGTAAGPISLSYGVTNIPVVVTATDGITRKIYTLKITRALPARPVIDYPALFGRYTVATPIPTIPPNNTGGPVIGSGFGLTTTFAGDNTKGVVNGSALASKFSSPTGLAYDMQGNLYVSDNDANLIRKITPAGAVSTFGSGASFNGPAGLAVDPAGNIYMADSHNFLIRKITADGTITTFAGNGKSGIVNGDLKTCGFANPTGLVFDSQGNLYVTDGCVVRKITLATGMISTLAGSGTVGFAEGLGKAASFSNLSGITIDGVGNLYVCDPGNYKIRRITPGGDVLTFAGSTTGTNDGTGTSASFRSPRYIVTDALGDMYVTDDVANVIRKVTPLRVVTTLTGSGRLWGFDGPKYLSRFNQPNGIVSDGKGYLYIADKANFLIRKVSLWGYGVVDDLLPPGIEIDGTTGVVSGTPNTGATYGQYHLTAFNAGGGNTITAYGILVDAPTVPSISYAGGAQSYNVNVPVNTLTPTNGGGYIPPAVYGKVTTLAGSGAAGTRDGAGTLASFNGPNALTWDVSGMVYVSDSKNGMIRRINPAGVVSTLFKNVNNGVNFSLPAGIAADVSGSIYINDYGLHTITEINFLGQFTKLSGISGQSGMTDGNGSVATFKNPFGLAINFFNNFVVTDQGNQKIRLVLSNGVTSTLAGTGSTGSANGAGTVSTFNHPAGIAADKSNVYVADAGNFLIRKITSTGVVSTLAGSGAPGTANGSGTAASFINPVGLAIDASGNLYVTDQGQNTIRKITSAGLVTTLAGSGALGSADGITTKASFNQPYAAATDKLGNLYVADYGSNLIRKIALTGYTITPSLPPGLNFDVQTGVITGTPTAASPATIYTITAYNVAGSSTTTLSITVNGVTADASLTALTLSAGNLNPVFSPNTVGYTATEVNAISNITLTPSVHISGATVKINGNLVASGTPSAPISLNVGTNTITTIVTAADGATTKTYRLTVGRAASPVTNLSGFTLSTGTLSPAFSPTVTAYKTSVANTVTAINVTPATTDPSAVIKVNGTVVSRNSASGNIALGVGGNTITTTITAQDGVTTQTYTLVVTRAASSVATLSSLSSDSGGLNPVFSAEVSSYTAGVTNTTSTFNIRPGTASTAAVIKINGSLVGSGSVYTGLLSVGSNLFNIVVTAEDGVTSQTYTLTVNRALSSVALLSGLSTSAGRLNPGFSAGLTSYTVSVPASTTAINFTPVLQDATASVTVNDTAVNNGSASSPINLNFGDNRVSIKVTAQDGVTTQNYLVNVNRATSAAAALSSLSLSSGTLSPAFASGTTNYTASVTSNISSMTLTSITTDATATVTVNGATPGIIALNPGVNTILIVVTAQNGTTKQTYTLTVTRAAATAAIISVSPMTAFAGTSVLINGTNFNEATAVNFGGTAATSFSVISPNSISAVIGGGSSGMVSVTTPTNTATLAGFNFVAPPTVTANGSTTFAKGGSVTLSTVTGSGFSYQWLKDGQEITGANAAAYTATESGQYTVMLTLNGISQLSAAVAVSSVFVLPALNFTLTTTTATCVGSANGAIKISALQNLNYTATITGNGINATYPFTTALTINSLPAGNYSVCFSVEGQPNYQQCFTAVIGQPKALALYTLVTPNNNSLTLNLEGGDYYEINLNGVVTTTTASTVTLPLMKGNNKLLVSTDKPCQGMLTKQINVGPRGLPYPNPATTFIRVDLGDVVLASTVITIYDGIGTLVYSKTFVNSVGVVQLDLSGLLPGIYFLHLTAAQLDKTFRIQKI